MKPVFNRKKLESLIEDKKYDVQPTDKFVLEELERCKDPRYFYNNYYTINGQAVKPVSEEEWKSMQESVGFIRGRRTR